MITISNEWVSATINPLGAELSSLIRTDLNINYLWNGDPKWWGKHSPVLFPVVGSLQNNTYVYKDAAYILPRHGFAREKLFTVEKHAGSWVSFTLQEDESSLKVFPFPFLLRLTYILEGTKLRLTYTVTNTGTGELFFCIGAHPAFAVPLVDGTNYGDYYLEFDEKETLPRFGLTDGLVNAEPETFLVSENRIQLSAALFERDAIVVKHPVSSTISLRSNATQHGFTFSIKDWPHLGIWAAANAAPFVCIEPWQGHADTTDHDGMLIHKPGVVELASGDSWAKDWWVELF
jgi:galactose mutarotase-like enzyme